MKIKVNNCMDCPFCHSDFDDFSTGADTLDICVLARHLNIQDSIINARNMEEEMDDVKPEWCPLLVEDFSIKMYKDE